MRHRGALGFLGALLIAGIVGTLMALSYGAGAASSGAVTVTSGGRHFFGFLFLVLIVMMIFGLIRAGHRGYRHGAWDPGYVGPGEWHGHGHWRNDEWAESRKAALNEWHREAHAGQDPAAGDTSGDAASGPMRGPQP
jgi:hypothetical protein